MENKIETIVERFQKMGFAQVPGYKKFGYISKTDKALTVSREKGKDTPIPYAKIEEAIKAIRLNNSVYDNGPSSLRKYGITHITSPVWALVHLLSLQEIKS
jgi:hypothetical protein